MNRRNWPLFTAALVLIAGSAGLLACLSGNQKLGPVPVKAHPLADSNRLQVELPEHVLDYQSEWVDVDELTLNTLPPDTSFGQRRYKAPDGLALILNAVLMGADRTSLHKPQFCLTGQGYQIDESTETKVHIDQPCSYDLPVVKLVASKEAVNGGQRQVVRAVYVYWFVADDGLSASISGFERMWLMGSNLLRTGILQRWAYISCLSVCLPGQEEATFQRMAQFIAASVPEFQLNPRSPQTTATARP
jgi:hypothetical protein